MFDEIMGEFLTDTQAHFEAVEEAMLSLEQNANQPDLIDDLFRHVHSVKGNAGVLGVNDIYEEGQKFENFLEGVRERRTATPEEMDKMFQGFDILKALLAKRLGGEPSISASEVVEEAQPVSSASAPSSSPIPGKTAPPASPAPSVSVPVGSPPKKSGNNAPTSDELATQAKEAALEPDHITILSFSLAGERYGIEILMVREIILTEPVTPVPNTKDYVAGVMNLRDQVIPVFDLRKKLEMPVDDGGSERNIMIVDYGGVVTGLLVDEVLGITVMPKSKIAPPDRFAGSIPTEQLLGIGNMEDGSYILLDTRQVCSPSELLY